MTEWQTILSVLIVSAALTGRQWLLVSVIVANFLSTMELAGNPVNVAIADAIAATALLFMGARARVVAIFYAVMIPIYPAMQWAGFESGSTYAIVDALAILQIAVAGRWDVGSGRVVRLVAGGRPDIRRAYSVRGGLAERMGVSETEGQGS